MVGRKPIPISLQKVRGKQVRGGKKDLPAEIKSPVCPEMVKAHPTAEARWNYYIPLLMKMRILTEGDQAILQCLCMAEAFMADNVRQMFEMNATGKKKDALGYVIPTKNGYLVKNQFYANVDTSMKQIAKFATELGLTPVSRARMAAPNAQPEAGNKWAAL